jgi:nitric oxide reductase NorD protein
VNLLHLLEPEEAIGNLWHALVGGRATQPHFPDAAVAFDNVSASLRIFFHGLGGPPGVALKPSLPEVSRHRLSRRIRLGTRNERVARARYDGERFSLPAVIDVFPNRELNERLYFWLAAWTAAAGENAPHASGDAYRDDIDRIDHSARTAASALRQFPGLARHYDLLRRAAMVLRPERDLPPAEAAVEKYLRSYLALSAQELTAGAFDSLHEPVEESTSFASYRTYLPVPLWGEIELSPENGPCRREEDASGPGGGTAGDGRMRRARRRASDQLDRKGGFFVHRFEKILSWTEFMNLHRNVEDDDMEAARKAADDHDEIGIASTDRKAATRLVFDLDLAPADVDRERLCNAVTYHEWDFRRQAYLPDHVRVLERPVDTGAGGELWQPGPQAHRRIRAVRRQFEALRPRRELLTRQLDGSELDIDALVRSRADLLAFGEGSDRIFGVTREQARDLSVAVLVDVSRSTEGFVDNRAVIDIEKEALVALAEGLDACGDEAAIFAFSSLRRDRVYMTRLKEFSEKAGPLLRQRIASLKPGFYTRLGAAIRHASAGLAKRSSRKRLLIVLSDGKPNDLDHYEGRYGVEDTRRAVIEARQAGLAVFGVTIDSKAQGYISHIFGANGFAVLSHPGRLTAALPVLYRQLVV